MQRINNYNKLYRAYKSTSSTVRIFVITFVPNKRRNLVIFIVNRPNDDIFTWQCYNILFDMHHSLLPFREWTFLTSGVTFIITSLQLYCHGSISLSSSVNIINLDLNDGSFRSWDILTYIVKQSGYAVRINFPKISTPRKSLCVAVSRSLKEPFITQ